MTTSRYAQIMKTFGKRLRQARERAGYRSAQEFAGVLGKEPHTYRHYERGEAEPDFDTLTRLCELLDVTPNYLFPQAAQGKRNSGPTTPRAVA